MNKFMAAVLSLSVIFGVGTTVWAGTQSDSFQDMLPFMQQMHPNYSENDLKEMYNNCHES